MNESIQKLKSDVGLLTDLPVKQARGIVNQLASGQEVQRLCALAVQSLDTLLSKTPKPLAKDDEEVKISQSQSMVTNSRSLSTPIQYPLLPISAPVRYGMVLKNMDFYLQIPIPY
ncbi:hypothetical protein Hanom_Chr11g01036811 [Helianthus anomalus]